VISSGVTVVAEHIAIVTSGGATLKIQDKTKSTISSRPIRRPMTQRYMCVAQRK